MRTTLLLLLLVCTLPAFAQEVTEPKFQGAAPTRFATRLVGEFEKIVRETGIPAAEFSGQVYVGFKVDTTGVVTGWRYLDNASEGRDFRDAPPASAQTREVLEQALARLEKWTPAEKNGCPVEYGLTFSLRLPVEKLALEQDGTPLYFLGQDPKEALHPWVKQRVRYDDSRHHGEEGLLVVKFYVEMDGTVTISEVEKSPSEQLSREVIRVLRNTKGKWTPKKRNDMPVRSIYEYRCYYSAS